MTEELRSDVAAAAERMGSAVGARKELRQIEEHLPAGETVQALVAARRDPGTGLLVLTDKRVLFIFDGLIRDTVQDYPLATISSVQWETGLNLGTLTLLAGAEVDFHGVDNDAGAYFVERARELLSATSV